MRKEVKRFHDIAISRQELIIIMITTDRQAKVARHRARMLNLKDLDYRPQGLLVRPDIAEYSVGIQYSAGAPKFYGYLIV
jgi:hypothetical protein